MWFPFCISQTLCTTISYILDIFVSFSTNRESFGTLQDHITSFFEELDWLSAWSFLFLSMRSTNWQITKNLSPCSFDFLHQKLRLLWFLGLKQHILKILKCLSQLLFGFVYPQIHQEYVFHSRLTCVKLC